MSTELATRDVEPISPMMTMIGDAVRGGADIAVVERLMALHERMQAKEAKAAFDVAMASFKATCPKFTKNIDKKAGQMDLKYASLDHILDTVTPAMSSAGFRHRWVTEQEGNRVKVTCVLSHIQGHSEQSTLGGDEDKSGGKNAIHAIASAVSYLERYTFLAVTGLTASGMDNDGGEPVKTSQSMGDEEFIGYRDAIEGATTLKELQDAFTVAYKSAQALGDKAAQADLIKAKDARKGKIS